MWRDASGKNMSFIGMAKYRYGKDSTKKSNVKVKKPRKEIVLDEKGDYAVPIFWGISGFVFALVYLEQKKEVSGSNICPPRLMVFGMVDDMGTDGKISSRAFDSQTKTLNSMSCIKRKGPKHENFLFVFFLGDLLQ